MANSDEGSSHASIADQNMKALWASIAKVEHKLDGLTLKIRQTLCNSQQWNSGSSSWEQNASTQITWRT